MDAISHSWAIWTWRYCVYWQRSNGITNHSYRMFLVQNPIFHSFCLFKFGGNYLLNQPWRRAVILEVHLWNHPCKVQGSDFFENDFIKCSWIETHMPFPFFLWSWEHWCGTWCNNLSNGNFFQEVFHLSYYLFIFHMRCAVGNFVW